MKKQIYTLALLLLMGGLFLASCQPKAEKYSMAFYIEDEKLRTDIHAQIITYIYTAPPGFGTQERFDAKHKGYYRGQIPNFEVLRYHVGDDGYHYFYMMRPARNIHNHKRGVGGKFRWNEDGSFSDFEEVWVTPMAEEEKVRSWAAYFFPDFIKTGKVDDYLPNKSMVEFPNDDAKYDKERLEWRYDVE